jgi:hypothetical protein
LLAAAPLRCCSFRPASVGYVFGAIVCREDRGELETVSFVGCDVEQFANGATAITVAVLDRYSHRASDFRLAMPICPAGAPIDHVLLRVAGQLHDVDGDKVGDEVALALRNLASPAHEDQRLDFGEALMGE